MRTLLEFHRSPNSVKVRVALGYKGLEYEIREMMAADRAPMIEAAGWPLVPILVDGDVVMRDSAAILHYLEANYREAPSLTPDSRDDILAAETLLGRLTPELLRIQWGLNAEIGKPDQERNRERIVEARPAMVRALGRLERRLSAQPWLVADTMSIYDIILASNLLPTRPPPHFVEESPIWRFFADHFQLTGERPAVAAWLDRVVAHDGKL